jgi:hypothetical protein
MMCWRRRKECIFGLPGQQQSETGRRPVAGEYGGAVISTQLTGLAAGNAATVNADLAGPEDANQPGPVWFLYDTSNELLLVRRPLSQAMKAELLVLASDDPARASMQLLGEMQLLSDNSVLDTDANALLSAPNGTLLKAGTVESYVAAVAELYSIQVTSGYNKEPFFRGKALNQLIEARRRQRDQIEQRDLIGPG